MARGALLFLLAAAGCASGSGTTGSAADAAGTLDAASVADAGGSGRPDASTPVHDAEVEDAQVASDAAAPEDAAAPDAATSTDYVYAGSSDDHIYIFTLDHRTGALTPQGSIAAGTNPSFLAVDPSHRHLYAVNEGPGPNGQVAAFSVDAATGALSFLNRVASGGAGPTHLSVDPGGGFVLVANYGDGAVSSLPILAPDGRLGPPADTEHAGMNAHLIVTDPAGRFAFVPCKGSNYIAQYALDLSSGTLTPNDVATILTARGAGPRHLAFHPSARWAYGINENNSTMTAYAYDAATGRLTEQQTSSTLPAGFSGSNTGAEVAVDPSGRFVFGSNRGHDSIVSFAIDSATGLLALIGHASTGGATPRSFGLTPDGSLLYVANQDSGTIHALRVELGSGMLSPLGEVARVSGPAFVGVFSQP